LQTLLALDDGTEPIGDRTLLIQGLALRLWGECQLSLETLQRDSPSTSQQELEHVLHLHARAAALPPLRR
jgi:hypothetical protein